MSDNVERRAGGTAGVEGRHVQGYAAVFESSSRDLGGFSEIIERGAFDGVIENSDVLALLNHDIDRGVLARCRAGVGSMTLSIDERGLRYEFDAPDTPLGNEVLTGIARGDIAESSFAFTVSEDSWENNGRLRRIRKVERLVDVSPVYFAAYPDTSVALSRRNAANMLSDYYDNKRKELEV